jgi:hypothetical protein
MNACASTSRSLAVYAMGLFALLLLLAALLLPVLFVFVALFVVVFAGGGLD